jgi:hypothetical protein
MAAKELIEARWKAIIGMALAIVTILVGAFTFDLVRSALSSSQLGSAPSFLGGDFMARLSNYSVYVWSQDFSPSGNSGLFLMIVAALIGASLVAGEVSKGTIFLLLSRPLSRNRILLTKYLVGAAILLAMNVLAGVAMVLASAIAGHFQGLDLGGAALSVLLFWLGTLFVLGLATLFSVVFNDVLRPLALTVGAVLLLNLPAFFPHGSDWVLPGYWTSLPAFLGHEFPTKALVISLIAAVIPILAAVPLFRRQNY